MTSDYMTTFCVLCYLALAGISFAVMYGMASSWLRWEERAALLLFSALLWPLVVFVLVACEFCEE